METEFHINMHQRLTRLRDIKARYQRLPSLASTLPWIAYHDHYCLLADGISLGAGFSLEAIDCEGLSETDVNTLADKLTRLLQSFPQDKTHPWVVQCFVSRDNPSKELTQALSDICLKDALAQKHQAILTQHWQRLSQPQGSFIDHTVTGLPFRLQGDRIQCFIYRWHKDQTRKQSQHALDQVCTQFTEQLQSVGYHATPLDAQAFYQMLLAWFNPGCDLPRYPENPPYGWEIANHCFLTTPRSFDQGWYFNKMPHRILPIQGLMSAPKPGLLTHAPDQASLWDRLPLGSIFSLTWVVQHQDQVRAHLARMAKSAVGGHAQAQQVKEEVRLADQALAKGSGLFPCVMNLYLRASDEATLAAHLAQAQATLTAQGLTVIEPEYLLCPADAYLRYLPFCYDHGFDQHHLGRSQYLFAQHIAHMLPLYGRSKGSASNACFYNRSGAPFGFNPLQDYRKNPHLLVLGETGTGKSNLLVHLLAQALATEKPRLFIIEAGGSFDLFADFLNAHGLSVNHVKIDPQHPIALNPFAAIGEDTSRDIIGEMAISAQIMITGGDANETLSRQDKLMIVEVILTTQKQYPDRQILAQDLVAAFETHPWEDTHKKQRAQVMADGLKYFCLDPLSNDFFNQPGEPWPLVDVTIVDFGLFAGSGYEAHRAIAFAGCYHKMLALAEANQSGSRRMIAAFDENHLFTKVPLLAELQTRLAKMGRKLGLGLWLLTQNMADFPDEAHKMLAMLETFICLALPPDEIAQVERFKPLTDAQRKLLLSAQKAKGQYTEGVIISPALTGLFRHIPPKAYLALAGTEQHEKHARAQMMEKTGCAEWEAALKIADV